MTAPPAAAVSHQSIWHSSNPTGLPGTSEICNHRARSSAITGGFPCDDKILFQSKPSVFLVSRCYISIIIVRHFWCWCKWFPEVVKFLLLIIPAADWHPRVEEVDPQSMYVSGNLRRPTTSSKEVAPLNNIIKARKQCKAMVKGYRFSFIKPPTHPVKAFIARAPRTVWFCSVLVLHRTNDVGCRSNLRCKFSIFRLNICIRFVWYLRPWPS